jgi:hypothetical protein
VYRFTAINPFGKSLRVLAQVPNTPCDLHTISIIEPEASLTDAQLALTQAQGYASIVAAQVSTATTQAGIATTQASTATANASISTTQATISSTQAGIATSQAVIATTQAGLASTARAGAETARDSALVSANLYASEALGRAAVADGLSFNVQGTGDVAVQIYRRINSTTSTLLADLASNAALSFASRSAEQYAFGGQVLHALTDSSDRAVATWLLDGVMRGKLGLQIAPTSPLSLTFSSADGLTTLDSPTQAQADDVQFVGGVPCIGALTDSAGRAYLALLQNGKTYIPKLTADSFVDVGRINIADAADYFFTESTVGVAQQIMRTAKVGGAVAQITSTGENTAPRVSSDGTRVVYTSTRTTPPSLYTQPVGGGAEQPVQSTGLIVALGNSISVSSGYALALAALRPLDTVVAQGVSGQRTDDIAYRFGASPLTLSVTGASIPAGGSVGVTGLDTTLFRRTSGTASVRAVVAGVAGVLSVSASLASFTRDSAGTAVAVTNPAAATIASGFLEGSTNPSAQLDLSVLQSATVLMVAASYNDIREAAYNQAATLANIAATVATLRPLVKRLIIAGDMQGQGRLTAAQFPANPDPPANAAASQQYLERSIALNAALAVAYPQAYVDLHAALVAAGSYSVFNVNGTNYNIIDLTVLPDGIHPSGGGTATVAGIINNIFTSRGW